MKDFFKFFTASCLGVFAAILLILLFFTASVGSMMSNKPAVPNNAVLEINLSNAIPEKTNNIEISALNFESSEHLGLQRIKDLIVHAATDDKIKGLVIKGQSAQGGQATISSIRKSLLKFKESNKFIYAYGDIYSQSGYYLSAVADSIFLNPNGMVDVKGFSTLIPFFKEGMDKLGAKMNVFYAGNFKSATEPFRRSDMSEQNRLQTTEFLNEMINIYKNDISASRGMSVAQIDDIMSNYKGKNAKSALDCGLVDQIAYWDEVEDLIRHKLDIKEDKKIKMRSLTKYNDAVTIKKTNASQKNKVAILFAEGSIKYGSKEKGAITEEKYMKALEKIENDDKIKALVIRINSGGGSSITSDIIWHGIEKVKATGKPVVASFGDYAASGGYYIASGADTIVSAPNCLTGSIGVFMMFPNFSKLANDKLGINFDEVKTHPMAVGPTMVKDLTEAEKQLLQSSTEEIYETFLDRVSTGRGMSRKAVQAIAQGRVWTGKKGKEIGLVDVIGDLNDAIRIASEMANIEKFSLKSYPVIKEDPWAQIIKSIAKNKNVSAHLGIDNDDFEMIKDIKATRELVLDRTPQARLPFIFQAD